jgi:hypothetical protein
MANENKLHGAEAKRAWESISGASQAEILRELGLVPPVGTPPSDYVSSSAGNTSTGSTSTGSGSTGGTTETVTVTTHTPESRSDNLTASTTDARNTATEMYKDLYDAIMNNDPTKTDWGKTLLNYYGIKGLSDANGVRGSGAADNAGNVDSYAAANAARQRLSTLNQGVNAVMGEAQNRYTAALETLKSLGVDTTNLLGIEGDNVESSYGYGASLYNSDKTLEGVKDTNAASKYNSDQNLLGVQDTNKTNKELAESSKTTYPAFDPVYAVKLTRGYIEDNPDIENREDIIEAMTSFFQQKYGLDRTTAYTEAVLAYDQV